MKNTSEAFFKKLTWNDIKIWAGSTIAYRGKDYQSSGQVQELAFTPDGDLIAWVQGTRRYAARVGVEDEQLASQCTCPYGGICKHAVAVVLDYLDKLKKSKQVPSVNEKDKRLLLLAGDTDDFSEDDIDDVDDIYNENEDEDEEDPEETGIEDYPASSSAKTLRRQLHSFLEKQNKAQLISLLETLADRYPDVASFLTDQSQLSLGEVQELVKSTRKKIDRLTSERGWSNHWNNESYTPNYTDVFNRLEMLLAAGRADDVLNLGKKLLASGTTQVEESDDEGETGNEISACLDIVFDALPRSSLSPSAQMLWAVEADLADEYELTVGSAAFWELERQPADWSTLAGVLLQRLKKPAPGSGKDEFSGNYHRDQLTDWIIKALEKAGRQEEVIPLCQQEAAVAGSYVRLVDRLLQAGRRDEAEQEIYRGIKATQKNSPGTAAQLRDNLRDIRVQQGDWLAAAALRADDFFVRPGLKAFQELQQAAGEAGDWPAVRTAAMHYLETGTLPSAPSWPLPETGLRMPVDSRQNSFPLVDTLLDIAIAEKQPPEVIRWYDYSLKIKGYWQWSYSSKESAVAEAVAGAYPERSIAIWKKLAENLIAQTKPSAYEEAGVYLTRVKRLLYRLGKEAEWQGYLAALRSANNRKIRLLDVLAGLESKPLVESP